MPSGILGIAVTGLNAAQAGIRTTEHNISNANTAGYRRQEVGFGASQAQYSGTGYFGNGVEVTTVRNQFSQFLDQEVLLNQSQLSRHETFSAQASQIDKLLGDAGSGMSTAMDAFFGAVNELANDPTSNAARQVLLSAGNNLAGRINTLDSKLRDYRTSSNSQITTLTDSVNTLARQIAQLNGNISRSEAVNGQPANDLRDQRDVLIANLNKLVNVSQLQQPDGSTNIYIGSGQALVVGTQTNAMGTVQDPNDSGLLLPTVDVGGATMTMSASMITGGELGGILAVREQVLAPAFEDLNRIAVSIGLEVNRVHRAGLDYNLNAGGAFFTDPIAAAAGNTGVLRMTLGNDLQLTGDNYSLAYDGTDYTLTRYLPDGTTSTTVGNLAAVNAVASSQGFTLSLPTAAAAGDSWSINLKDYSRSMRMVLTATSQVAAAGSTADGPGDNSNALNLAALQSSTMLNNGTVTLASAYNQTVSRTATLASEADLNRSAFAALTTEAETAQKAVSGVSLDEEAANLIRFQQAYQASAKAIQVATSLFDTLIGALR